MSCISIPEKIYFKKGCMPVALDELGTVMGKKKAFILTDKVLYDNGSIKLIEQKLNKMNIQHICYFDIPEKLTFQTLQKGAKEVCLFEPDVIISVGSKSVLEAGKLMRVMYEYPEEDVISLAEKFSDIRCNKGIFPRTGKKAYLVTIPTELGSNSEVTPCAEFSDGDKEYVISDYELMAEMVITDSDNMTDKSDKLTSLESSLREIWD